MRACWGRSRIPQMRTSRSGCGKGSGASSTALIRLKMAQAAPMPSISVTIIARAKPGWRRSCRTESRRSWSIAGILVTGGCCGTAGGILLHREDDDMPGAAAHVDDAPARRRAAQQAGAETLADDEHPPDQVVRHRPGRGRLEQVGLRRDELLDHPAPLGERRVEPRLPLRRGQGEAGVDALAAVVDRRL